MPSTAKVTVDVQAERLMDLGRSAAGPIFQHMVKLEAKVETAAKRNASGPIVGVRTGNLRSSIHSTTEVRGTLLVGIVTADASYALAVHEGTREHDIVPVAKKVLAWTPAGGSPVFATKVHQPARKGRPFLVSALDALTTIR